MSVNTAEDIFKSIKKKIVKLEYLPGSSINESQMCAEYNVSRSIIRVVFTRLHYLKLIDIFPQRGTYVAKIDLDLVDDILTIRTALEKEIIEEIFNELNDEERKKLVVVLNKNIESQKKAIHDNIYDENFRKLDAEFHKLLVNSVNKRNAFDLMNNYYAHLSRWRNLDICFNNRLSELYEEHKEIVDSIRNNDEYKTKKAISNHLMTVKSLSKKLKEEYPNYFV